AIYAAAKRAGSDPVADGRWGGDGDPALRGVERCLQRAGAKPDKDDGQENDPQKSESHSRIHLSSFIAHHAFGGAAAINCANSPPPAGTSVMRALLSAILSTSRISNSACATSGSA